MHKTDYEIHQERQQKRKEWQEEALEILRDPNSLALDMSAYPLMAPQFAAIAKALPQSNIKHLALGREYLNDEALAPIIDILPQCPKLETVQLHTGGSMRVDSLRKLTEILPQTNITSIGFDVYYPRETQAMCDFMEAVGRSKVDTLNVCGQDFSDEEAMAIVPLVQSGQIKKLEIERGSLSEEGMEKFFEALRGSKLETFRFHALGTNQKITNKAAQAMADIVAQGDMTELDLPSCRFTAETAAILMEGVKNSQLTRLNLAGNERLEAEGLAVIAEALPDTQLRLLGINRCSPQGEGYDKVFDALPFTQVEELLLNSSRIDQEQIKHLAKALPCSQIRILSIAANPIGLAGHESLANALPSSPLISLDISETGSLTPQAAEAWGAAIPKSNLGHLDFSDRNLRQQASSTMKQAVVQSQIAMVKCYGSSSSSQIQEDATACYTHARKNLEKTHALAMKIIASEPKLEPAEWEAAVENLGAIRCYLQTNWKLDDFTRLSGQEIDTRIADKFLQSAQDMKPETLRSALTNLLNYKGAINALEQQSIPCKAADLVNADGSLPEKPLCRGGFPSLFGDATRWKSAAEHHRAFSTLSDEQKSQVPNYHSVRARISSHMPQQDMGRA